MPGGLCQVPSPPLLTSRKSSDAPSKKKGWFQMNWGWLRQGGLKGPDSTAIPKHLPASPPAPSLSLAGEKNKPRDAAAAPGRHLPLLAALAPHEVAVGWRETPRRAALRLPGAAGFPKPAALGQLLGCRRPWGWWGGLSAVLCLVAGCVRGGRAPRCVFCSPPVSLRTGGGGTGAAKNPERIRGVREGCCLVQARSLGDGQTRHLPLCGV